MTDADLYLIAITLKMLNKAELERLEAILDNWEDDDAQINLRREAPAAVFVN